MSFLRVTNPVASAFDLPDLGITIAASATNIVLSSQFNVEELVRSADLETAIINEDLEVEIDYGTGFTAILAADYTNRDALGAFLNVFEISNENGNEALVDGTDATTLHMHDSVYFTETELGADGGADLIGVDDSDFDTITGTTVQEALDSIDDAFVTANTLDTAYTNDTDGIMDVNGTTKPLNLRSDNLNDIAVSRTDGIDDQDAMRFDVSANQLDLGAPVEGALPAVNVRVRTDLRIEGNLTVVGTVTDETVNELNVTNANIKLREGAASGADASILVERGSDGADASLLWDETDDRWKAGLEGSEQTIALLEEDESVSGVWKFGGADTTEPNMLLEEKSAAPSTELGSAGQIPMAMMTDGILAVYDKSNSRNKFLSVERLVLMFNGRNSPNNKAEYLYAGQVNTMQAGIRLPRNATLVAASVQSGAAATYNIRVRKNASATNLASLAVTAAAGAQSNALNLDLSAGDHIQIYLDSAVNVEAPVVMLELAYRY